MAQSERFAKVDGPRKWLVRKIGRSAIVDGLRKLTLHILKLPWWLNIISFLVSCSFRGSISSTIYARKNVHEAWWILSFQYRLFGSNLWSILMYSNINRTTSLLEWNKVGRKSRNLSWNLKNSNILPKKI